MQLNSRIVACLFLLAACSVHDQNLIPDINTSQLGKNLTEQLTPVLETLKDSPGNAEAAGQAGNILQAYDQHGLAAKLYEHALAISPNKFAWEYNLGVAYASLGRYADSQTSFEQYIQHDATYAPAFLRLARSLSEQGHYSESISNYHAFLKKRPGNSQALFGLGYWGGPL